MPAEEARRVRSVIRIIPPPPMTERPANCANLTSTGPPIPPGAELPDGRKVLSCYDLEHRQLTTKSRPRHFGWPLHGQSWICFSPIREFRSQLSLQGLSSVGALTDRHSYSPHVWSDAFLAALALQSNLELVTFDRGLLQYKPTSVTVLT
jgi:hypothetical protein